MKKTTLLPVMFLFLGGTVSAQIGINTSAPNSTMDVSAKRNSGGTITDNTQLFGLQAPRLTRAELTANTATYGTNQQGALIYITDVSGGTATGQRVNIDEVGYYSFDGNVWKKLLYKNIYNADGSLTGTGTYRTLTLNGMGMNISGTNQRSSWNSAGVLYQENLLGAGNSSAIVVSGGNSSDLYLQQFYNGAAQIQAAFNSTSLDIATNGSASSAPVTISTSSGGGALASEKMRITGLGNVGVGTSSPTEKFDNNGITRLRILPLNGATNAIYTQSNGSASATQNQTFTATRTVVADANGVLGYVAGTPSSPGVPKLLVSAGVPGTQNIKGNVNIVGNYSVEYLDVYNAWTSNVFTVPTGQTGIYIVAMQTSHLHTVDASTSWFTIARIQKSTDGGTTWVNVLNDTQASNLGTDVDNGNKLYWTSALNAGDKIRIVYQCSSIGDNIVTLGSLTITQLNQ